MFQEIRLSLIWKSWITVGMGKSSKANYRLLTSLADSTFYRFTILCKPFCHHSNNRMSFIFSFLYQVLVKPRASNASVIKYQRNLFSFDSSVKSLALLNQDLHSKKKSNLCHLFTAVHTILMVFIFFRWPWMKAERWLLTRFWQASHRPSDTPGILIITQEGGNDTLDKGN